jgi:FAD-dependent urate hydroxylase
MEGVRVLIVGAGLAGLALARALRQADIGAELIERQAGWDAGGTGIYLPANGVRALAALGLGDAVAAAAVGIPSQRLLTHRGQLLAEIGMRDVWGDVGACLALPRATLHRMLRDGVPLRLGRTIRALEQVDGPVQVTFDDGTSGEYDLVVGADGLHSTVRRLAVDDRPPVPVGQLSWRFLAPRPAGAVTWSAMLGRDATFLTIPIGEESIYCYADVGGRVAPSDDPVAVLRERFAGFAAPGPELLDHLAPGEVHVAPIEEVDAERWGRGAVVLIGDAAHGMSPNMAQGASLAFEDALELAACLRDAISVAEAGAELAARRCGRTRWVRERTHRRDRTRGLPPAVRNLVLRSAARRIFQADYRPLLEPVPVAVAVPPEASARGGAGRDGDGLKTS